MALKKSSPQKQNKEKENGTAKFNMRAKDLPATQGMLQLVRSELKAEMRSGFRKVDARFNQMEANFSGIDARFKTIDARFNEVDARFSEVDARFNQIDARFSEIDARFSQVDSRLNTFDSKFEQVLSEIARVGFLVEEQNSRNLVVLEGLTGLFQRQERLETRVDGIDSLVQSIAARSRR
jgi:archaellum component FlaC